MTNKKKCHMNLEETLLFNEQSNNNQKKNTLISDFEITLNSGICTIN